MYKPCSEMVGFSGTETFIGSVTKWLKSFDLLTVTLEIKNTYQKNPLTLGFSGLSSIPVVQEKRSQHCFSFSNDDRTIDASHNLLLFKIYKPHTKVVAYPMLSATSAKLGSLPESLFLIIFKYITQQMLVRIMYHHK